MVLLNPRGHGYNDKFDEIIEQLDFMDNWEQKKNIMSNKLEYFVSSHYIHEVGY